MCGWDDWAFEESGAVINEVGEAVWIDSSVDLLDDCAFDEVTHLERLHGCGVDFLGATQVWEVR